MRRYVCPTCRHAQQRASLISHAFSFSGAQRSQQRLQSTLVGRAAPLRVGIIGSGPAGFYAAARILQKSEDARVDMYEQLPVPFGLVRFGVAPDHPEVKNCQDRFDEVAQSPRFQFIGNIDVGRDVSLSTLRRHYDALLFAYGASKDRLLNIPGEDLFGVHSARAFVGWYNGLPEFMDLTEQLQQQLQDTEHAVIVGNGNVALDVARILLTSVDMLRHSDIAEEALQGLRKSRVKRVTIAGRRGPMQAAFTIKEVRELINLGDATFRIDNADADGLLPSATFIASLPRLEQRKYRLSRLLGERRGRADDPKLCSLQFLVSPVSFHTSASSSAPWPPNHRLHSIKLQQNIYVDEAQKFQPGAQVASTQNFSSVSEVGLAFRSIGYRAAPLPGLGSDMGISFDTARGVIVNDGLGRAVTLGDIQDEKQSHVIPGAYCTGWVKSGPNGVIATTMEDAFAVADIILADWAQKRAFMNGAPDMRPSNTSYGWSAVAEEGNLTTRVVSWQGWKRIERAEIESGKRMGKPRRKFRTVAQMLQAAAG